MFTAALCGFNSVGWRLEVSNLVWWKVFLPVGLKWPLRSLPTKPVWDSLLGGGQTLLEPAQFEPFHAAGGLPSASKHKRGTHRECLALWCSLAWGCCAVHPAVTVWHCRGSKCAPSTENSQPSLPLSYKAGQSWRKTRFYCRRGFFSLLPPHLYSSPRGGGGSSGYWSWECFICKCSCV